MIVYKILKNCIYYQKTLKLSPLNRQMRVCAQCGTKKAAQMLVSQLSGHLKLAHQTNIKIKYGDSTVIPQLDTNI